jgi:cell division protein FtsI/penicillin-binding protein 2
VSSAPPSTQPTPRRPRTQREVAQAKRRRNRLLPLLVIGFVSLVVGVFVGAGNARKDAAEAFVNAWTKQDFQAMYSHLSSDSAKRTSVEDLAGAYLGAQRTATATAIDPGDVSGPTSVNGKDVVKVQMKIRTRLFGVVEGELDVPFEGDKIAWDPHLTFPGLLDGESLGRNLELSTRAAILARNGAPLAQGPAASRTVGSASSEVVGDTGKPDTDQAGQLQSEGYPSDVSVGVSGLERAFNSRLAGTPGGQLLAVKNSAGGDVPAGTLGRVLATAQAKPGQPVTTTIDPKIQEATANAIGGIAGGAVVLDAKNGNVLAMAGSAYSAPAPPGSTFKIITTTAALESKVVKLSDTFPLADSVNVGGRDIGNSNGEICGGTFVQAFAESCNSVFAPLGPKIGEKKMVDTAQKYGFNSPPELFSSSLTDSLDLPESSIPTTIGDDLDLGVTAIGQGEVLATPLEMATVAQTIAAKGLRAPTAIATDPGLAPDTKPVRVTDANTAGIIKNLMVDVVNNGTGTNADLGRIQVAGKTGTAELGPKPNQPPAKPLAPGETPPKPEQILDAWFTCFAPAEKPRIVVTTFVADASGDGGQVAAPIARSILSSAL